MSTDEATAGRPAVTAVVVDYNAGDHLRDAVASLVEEGVDNVVVVDNASSDDSAARAKREFPTTVVVPHANEGYGKGINDGADATEDPLIWCLNPDVVVHPGSLATLTKAFSDPAVAVVGPLILDPDGSTYPSARRFPVPANAVGHALLGLWRPGNRWTAAYKRLDSDYETATEVDWVSGASMLVRRSAFESVGGFDPGYFMYMEDVDLCWRLRQAGWKVVFEPAAAVTHVGAVSTRGRPYRMLKEHHRSAIRYNRRTARGAGRLLVPVLTLGLLARLPVAWVHQYLTRRKQR